MSNNCHKRLKLKTVGDKMSPIHKHNFSNLYIFATKQFKPLIFQTQIILPSNIGTRKSEFVAKTQILSSFNPMEMTNEV